MPSKTITLTDEVSGGIDRFIAAQEQKQSRDGAVNALLSDWLTEQGYFEPIECSSEVQAKGECE